MDERALRVSSRGGAYTDVSVKDAEGKDLSCVTEVHWSVAVGELCSGVVHLSGFPADLTIARPDYIIDAPDTQGIPLPPGLTVDQARAIHDLFGGLAVEYQQHLAALRSSGRSQQARTFGTVTRA